MLNSRLGIIVLGSAVAAGGSTRAQVPASLAPPHAQAQVQPPSEVLVKVNGESFTRGDLNNEIVQRSGGPGVARMGPEEPLPQLIVDVLDAMLLVQDGRKVGCAFTDDQIQALADMYRGLYHLTEEQFEDVLHQQHLTIATWGDMKRKQALIQCVQRKEVLDKVPLTDDEPREYYSTHLNQFMSHDGTIPFDQAREQINQRGDSARRRTEYRDYLERLRSDAVFEWQNADLKRAYDEGLSKK